MATSNQRKAGVLMPVASLPSRDGIGSFGREACQFVDILAGMGMKVWQILPLTPLTLPASPILPAPAIPPESSGSGGYLPKNRETEWVYPYAMVMALKQRNNQRCWNEWPKARQDWILDGAYDLAPWRRKSTSISSPSICSTGSGWP